MAVIKTNPTVLVRAIQEILFTTFFVLVYCTLAVVYLWHGVYHEKRWVKASLKCFPMAVLILWFVMSWWDNAGNCESTRAFSGTRNLVPIPLSPDQGFMITLGALIVSILGDACLVYPRVGFLGIVAFGCAQVMYAIVFGLHNTVLGHRTLQITTGVCVFLVSIIFSLILLPQLIKMVEKRLTLVLMLVLVVFYYCLVSLMMWTALTRFSILLDYASFAGFLGSISFYLSDFIIGLSAVYSHPIFERRILVMCTYYLAQILISYCILFSCFRK